MPYLVADQPTLQRSSIRLGGPRGTHEAVEFMLNHYEKEEGWRLVAVGESRYLKCLVYHLHREATVAEPTSDSTQ